MLLAPNPTCFLIADISGYTQYLAGVELDHAQDILADLIGAVVSSLGPLFTLSKLEGDAAFTYHQTDDLEGSLLLDTIERCYFTFRRRRRDVRQATSCDCNACSRIPDLNLKFVIHYGEAIYQEVAGQRELLGADVITVHRMLKNEVVNTLGIDAYALFSQQSLDAARLAPEELGMVPHQETYDSIGEVSAWVHDLEKRWLDEEARTRVMVAPEESVLGISIPTDVPPQIAWEYLTRPGQRMSWQPWVTDVEVKGAVGGRQGVGSANHCMHGPDAVIEEILDWRPYDYVTDRTTVETPGGPIAMLHTIEFEPTPAGTTIHMRFAAPETERERQMAPMIASAYGEVMNEAIPTLVAQLEAEMERVSAG